MVILCSGQREQRLVAARAREVEAQYIQDFTNWMKEMPTPLRQALIEMTWDDSQSSRDNEISQPHHLRRIFNDEGLMDMLIEDNPGFPPVNKQKLRNNFTRYYNSLGALSLLKFQCIDSAPDSRDVCPLIQDMPQNIAYNPTPLAGDGGPSGGTDGSGDSNEQPTPAGKIPETDPRCIGIVEKAFELDAKCRRVKARLNTPVNDESSLIIVNWCTPDVKEQFPHDVHRRTNKSSSNRWPPSYCGNVSSR